MKAIVWNDTILARYSQIGADTLHMASDPISSSEADERGQRLLLELRLLLMRQAADPFRSTQIPGLTLMRSAETSPCMMPGSVRQWSELSRKAVSR
jgi:hypothetical protein